MHALPSNRLRVAHVFENAYGGLGTFVSNFIPLQIADPLVAEVHLLFDPKHLGGVQLPERADRHFFDSTRRPWAVPRIARSIHRILRSVAPDVVFLHSSFAGIYGRLGSPRLRDWATIYCAHGWSFNQLVHPVKRWAYARIERWLSARADATISISHDEYAAATSVGIQPAIHRVIYSGARPATPAGAPPIAADPERINLGFIGRLDRQKGVDRLVAAFDDPRFEGMTLWLIGANAITRAPVIPERPNIHRLGPVPNANVDDYIRCFDAIVIPSRWEGFGMVALEAMRNARPVIANRVGGLAELVMEGRNGLFIDIEDLAGMQTLLLGLSKEDLQRMGKEAQTFAADFTWEKCFRAWRDTMLDATYAHRLGPHFRSPLDR